MTPRRLIICILFIPAISFAQPLSDTLLAGFYNKTLVDYFSDTTFRKNPKRFKSTLVQTDFDASTLLTHVGAYQFLFFDGKAGFHPVLDRPFKKNKGRSVYWIRHQTFGQDTVDIVIGGWTIEACSKKNISLGAWCGGDSGYVPEGRFIYSQATKTWTFIRRQEIKDQLLQPILDRLKKNKKASTGKQ